MAGFRNNFRSHGAFETTFRVTGGYQKAGTSFLKMVTGRILELVSVSKGASSKFILDFPRKKRAKIIKSTVLAFRNKKYSCVTLSL
jgi:hypothetical protein